jgi:FkbM family methyltransferase
MNLRFLRNRWQILRRYGAASPAITESGRWLALGALRCRLFGGPSHLPRANVSRIRNYRLPIGNGNQFIIVDLSSTSELDALEEVLVNKIYPFERIELKPAMILDCGAHVGYFSSLARIKFPEANIICWEPERHNYSRLTSQPVLKADVVTCLNAAVSDYDGWARLVGEGTGGKIEDKNDNADQLVKTINLPQWFDRNCRPPLLIKMDIEGHERRVLHALRDHWISPCVLFLETHQDNGDDAEILDDLDLSGFRIEHLRTHTLNGDVRIFKEYMCSRT